MQHPETQPPPPAVASVRHFNRFYTRQIGVLQNGLLSSSFSLTEVRVLYELAHRREATAVEICQDLGLDAGYLSRMLLSFEKQGLIFRERSPTDGRRSHLALTTKGQKVFSPLEARSNQQVASMLGALSPLREKRLLAAMHVIEDLLDPRTAVLKTPYLLRTHQPGDMGWVVHRHGVLYAQEYGYDERFEALVAEIVAEFIENFVPGRERCWIAEKDGEIVGSIFLVQKSKTISKLRLLLVEPSARGLGIGRRLVAECVRFAREAGYKRMMLWTQSELGAARHLYQEAGFQLANKQPHKSWSRDDLVAETWELKLQPISAA
ncbi:MAG TPA: helix-turn-helix domain-containing GNAT family N-acetyltransferase [Terriglobales bacterium]|jgi:DNA-binding MarR family transcriptional regulator/GNAT superfamily N-acetyltransferase|nr:helix-turn-helix domain-containing GNAT family N-acetyltransferase [Terriglobales bacterium]